MRRIEYIHGPCRGQEEDLPDTEAENLVATGFAKWAVQQVAEAVVEAVRDVAEDAARRVAEAVAPQPRTQKPPRPRKRA